MRYFRIASLIAIIFTLIYARDLYINIAIGEFEYYFENGLLQHEDLKGDELFISSVEDFFTAQYTTVSTFNNLFWVVISMLSLLILIDIYSLFQRKPKS